MVATTASLVQSETCMSVRDMTWGTAIPASPHRPILAKGLSQSTLGCGMRPILDAIATWILCSSFSWISSMAFLAIVILEWRDRSSLISSSSYGTSSVVETLREGGSQRSDLPLVAAECREGVLDLAAVAVRGVLDLPLRDWDVGAWCECHSVRCLPCPVWL